jgi:hypothetical protein
MSGTNTTPMGGRATLTYDLSKPEQVMAHKYAFVSFV